MGLTYSNVTATVALFVALGGTSYAVSKLPSNSVGSAQVRDGSLQSKDLAASAVSTTRGPRGAQGPAGSQGVVGPEGPRGPATVRIAPKAPNIDLTGAAGQPKTVRRMDNVPAGSWLLSFQGNAALFAPTALYAICALKVNGDTKHAEGVLVGQAANATGELGMTIDTVTRQTTAFNVTVDCEQSQNSAPAVIIAGAQIIATQVAEIVATP